MAYVVPRPNGRFEVRESLHTRSGPRAHTLAGFDVLTDEILAKAAAKAKRPFNLHAVLASGRRAGAPVMATIDAEESADPSMAGVAQSGIGEASKRGDSASRFVESSRRMTLALRRTPGTPARRTDPGAALIDLLGFADAVTRSQPARPFEPLTFPVLRKLVEHRNGAAVVHRG
jgi:hypothetical protein